MVAAVEVQEVARTARPLRVKADLVLDIDWIVRHTTMNDWDGPLYELGATAAMQLANQFNLEHGMINGRAKPKLTKGDAR